ncbi:MAG TPA: superoxide dismutase family protein [Beijerinckiaceae bacterium]|jgi:Cu-Zn family superoxide dismutase|nr:superoxide dismutase copper/zinc binding [Microvirga sp.]HZB37614.1 superoxide dismutase family protein [Beijerinckiaceae bacterium]
MRTLLAGLLATTALPALAQAPAQPQAAAPAAPVQTYEAPITGAKGDQIGKIAVRSSENATVVRITINAGGLTPGWHGIHFHSVGDCSDVGQFQLSKGHVNHENAKHGLLNPEGPDEGDLPNIYANADGSVNAEVSSESVVLTGEQGLKDRDGSALVIHANEDDHTSQPIGNAGARVGCAVIK